MTPGWNSITATYTDTFNGTRSTVRSVFYIAAPPAPSEGRPIVVQEAGSPYRRSLMGCAGCAYTTLSYSTPSYRSLDQDRSLTILYSSALSAPMGLVVLDVNANSTNPPDRMSVSLLRSPDNAPVQLSNGQNEVFYTGGRGFSRITAQFDASSYSTAQHPMTAVVRNWWGTSPLETTLSIKVLNVNDRQSAFGSGWSVAGLQWVRVINGENGDAMIVENGQVTLFENCGSGCWTSRADEGSRFARLASGLYHRRYTDGTVVEFEPGYGLMTASRDRFGLQTTFLYDDYQRLRQITDPAGVVTTIAWSGPPGVARTASITAPSSGGPTVQVNISAAGELISIIDPDNVAALSVGYANNRIVTATNRIGGTTTFAYDAHGALASATGPAVQTEDRGFASSTTTYGSRELALLPAPGTGNSLTPAANVLPDGVWLTVRTQRGDSTRIASNGAGAPTAIVTRNPQGKIESTTISYDDAGRPRTVRSTSGTAMQYHWSDAQLVQETNLASRVTTEYSRNSLGQVQLVWVDGTLRESNGYSADARSVLERTISGNDTTLFTYDGIGRVLGVRDGEGHQSLFTYQPGDRQNLSTVVRDGKSTLLTYDAIGRPRTVTDAMSRMQTTSYDALNRVTSVVAPDQSVSSWSYDDANREYTFTDARNQQYRTILDAAGLQRLNYDPSIGTGATSAYDSDGTLVSSTSKGGRTVNLVRDVMGRVTQVSAGGLVTDIAYDTAGTWVSYANAESVDTIFVDGAGRAVKQVTVRSGTPFMMTADYADAGARRELRMTSPAWSAGRELSFGVDTLGRPDMLTDPTGRGTSITYNRDHQPRTITLPTGPTVSARLKQSFTYAANDRLSGITHTVAPSLLDQSYSYDALNRLSVLSRGVVGDAMQRTVRYDLAGRLSQVADTTISTETQTVCTDPFEISTCYQADSYVYTPGLQESYGYDAVGNRTDRGAVTTAGNRLTSFDGYTMTYDADGNLATKVGPGLSQSFVWNALGQLESVTTNGSTTMFGYDGLGRRVRKTGASGVTERYLYDGANLVVQVNDALQPVKEYSYYSGVDQPHAVRTSGTGEVFYYLSGATGSVSALVNLSNQVVNRYEYTPFGQAITAMEQVSQPFRFTGREFDGETGLYYYRARYYDPALGRFISEDPIGLAGGVNPYAYVRNDPVNYVDPWGLDECTADQLKHGYENDSYNGEKICAKKGGTIAGVYVTAPWSTDWSAVLTRLLNGREISSGYLYSGYNIAIAEVPGSLGGPRRLANTLPVAGKIWGYTKHGIDQALSRESVGVSARAILDAVKQPLRIVQQSEGRVRYVGEYAAVILNRTGEVITAWARNSGGWRYPP